MNKEISTVLTFGCEGAVKNLHGQREWDMQRVYKTSVTLTVFKDSSREVGCVYINEQGRCTKLTTPRDRQTPNLLPRCVHKSPV